MKEDTQVTEDDLNGIDYMNGNSSGDTKGGLPAVNNEGEGLKGALAKHNQLHSQFNLQNERMWLNSKKNQIIEFQVEKIEYNNLPNGLTKYRLEQKILQNGVIGILSFMDEYYAMNIVASNWNIYDEPTEVTVIEPRSTLNGNKYKIGENIAIIRNNLYSQPTLNKVLRYIFAMERILFQIEKNVTRSAPKGILNVKNGFISADGDNGNKQGLEHVINGEDTFYTYNGNSGDESDPFNDNKDPLFIPIELTDKHAELIATYSFMKEETKEMIGANVNILNGKKERLVTGEINSQQDLPNITLEHMVNIRKNDIEVVNNLFNLNIEVKQQTTFKEKQEKNIKDNIGGNDE